MRYKMSKKAFTLAETIISITILGIIAVIIVNSILSNKIDKTVWKR